MESKTTASGSWLRKKRRPLRQLPLAPPPGDRCIVKKREHPAGCFLFFVAVATEWFNFLFLSAFFFYTEKKE